MARTVERQVMDLGKTARPREGDDAAEKTGSEKPESGRKVSSRKLSRWILPLVSAIAVAGVALWWVYLQNYESTDDAQIEGHLDLVSARISGTVTYINPGVENNQFVKAGTLLMELDPRDYAAELEHTKANLDTSSAEARSAQVTVPIVDASAFGQLHSAEAAKQQALASVESEQANLVAAEHKLQQDEAIYSRAERDRVRYQALVEKTRNLAVGLRCPRDGSGGGRPDGGIRSCGDYRQGAKYRPGAQPRRAKGGADRSRPHRSAAGYRRSRQVRIGRRTSGASSRRFAHRSTQS